MEAALTSSPKFKFGTFDGEPIVWAPGEAWVFRDKSWVPTNSSEVGMGARVLSKSDFDKLYPSVPGLPSSAFCEFRNRISDAFTHLQISA
jgi:hypothetical protein